MRNNDGDLAVPLVIVSPAFCTQDPSEYCSAYLLPASKGSVSTTLQKICLRSGGVFHKVTYRRDRLKFFDPGPTRVHRALPSANNG